MTAALEPEEMVYRLNEIFTHFDTLADRYGCEKIRTIGDGYMVAAGVPVPKDDRYPDGRIIQLVGVVFRGRLGSRHGEGDGEIAEVDWFSSDQLPEAEIMPADLPVVRHALSTTKTPLVD